MTIYEKINDLKKMAENARGDIIDGDNLEPQEKHYNSQLELYAKEKDQIAEWLQELTTYRECNVCEYNKAIDDFAEKLTEYLGVENATKYGNKNAEQQRNSYDTLMKYEIADAIDDVSNQLKICIKNWT